MCVMVLVVYGRGGGGGDICRRHRFQRNLKSEVAVPRFQDAGLNSSRMAF